MSRDITPVGESECTSKSSSRDFVWSVSASRAPAVDAISHHHECRGLASLYDYPDRAHRSSYALHEVPRGAGVGESCI